jgi:hypothetical protein
MDEMRKIKYLFLICGLLISVFGLDSCKPRCDVEAEFLKTVGLNETNDINRSMDLNNQKVELKASEPQEFQSPINDLKHPFKLIANANSFYYKFEKEKCEWVQLENLMLQINPDVILYPSETNLEGLLLGPSLFIDPEAIKEPTEVRIYYIGYYLDEAGEIIEPVAAFKDVNIYP